MTLNRVSEENIYRICFSIIVSPTDENSEAATNQ